MAHPAIADARAYLAGLRGVTVFDWPDEREPECRAFVIAGVRCYEVRASAGGASAAHHLRDGEGSVALRPALLEGRAAAWARLPGWP